MPTQTLLRIGQVCSILRPEFPDISISKLRFLEEQGLVRPHRTPGGYRMYTPENLRHLREILRMQRDEFLPLKVIRQELRRRLDEGAPRPQTEAFSLVSEPGQLGKEQLCERAQVDEQFLDECERHDLLTARRGEDGATYSGEDAQVVRCAATICRYGLTPRDLAPVRSCIDTLVQVVRTVAQSADDVADETPLTERLHNLEVLGETLLELNRHMFVRQVRQVTAPLQPHHS